MEEPLFKAITSLRKSGQLSKAWDLGCSAVKENPQDNFLKGAFFWVCYDYLKQVQNAIKERTSASNASMQPNQVELDRISFLLDWIIWLNIPPGGYEYRSLLLVFQRNLEYLPKLVLLLFQHRDTLFEQGDDIPYQGEKGESPSLMLNFARRVAKSWLGSEEVRTIDFDDINNYLQQIKKRVKDKQNIIWLDYDRAKCLIRAARSQEARQLVIPILRQKQSESWAWGALAATYLKEQPSSSITLYSQGILCAHEDAFVLPQLSALAKLLAAAECYEEASMCVNRAISCYEANGWRIKPNVQALASTDWYTSETNLDSLKEFLRQKAKDAPLFLYDSIDKACGVVINLHKSGKGFHLFLAPGKEISVPLRCLPPGSKPMLGDCVEVKLATNKDETAAIEATPVEPREIDGIGSVKDNLRVTEKGFGFVDDTFLPAHMISNEMDGRCLEVIRYQSFDKKKGQYGWRALIIKCIE